MTICEMWERGNNLLVIVLATLVGIAFLPDAYTEDHPTYKIDEGLLFILELVAFVWYFAGQNKCRRSITSMIVVIVS